MSPPDAMLMFALPEDSSLVIALLSLLLICQGFRRRIYFSHKFPAKPN